MVLCLTWEVDKIEIANSYIKMLQLPTRGTYNSLQNRRFFLAFVIRARSARNARRGKAHEK